MFRMKKKISEKTFSINIPLFMQDAIMWWLFLLKARRGHSKSYWKFFFYYLRKLKCQMALLFYISWWEFWRSSKTHYSNIEFVAHQLDWSTFNKRYANKFLVRKWNKIIFPERKASELFLKFYFVNEWNRNSESNHMVFWNI